MLNKKSCQARLYWRNIRANMDNDEYFKDFKLEDFRFIVVNKVTLTPLIWEFKLTQAIGTLVDTNGHTNRDPYDLGKELSDYLENHRTLPIGIMKNGLNTIKCLTKIS